MGNPVDDYFRLVEITKAGNPAAIRGIIAPDFVMHEDPGMPYGGVYRGPDGFEELLGKVWAAWGGSHFEPAYQIADPAGDRVCAVVRFRSVSPRTGEPVEALINEVWTFRDGQAVEAQVWYYNSPGLCRALTGE